MRTKLSVLAIFALGLCFIGCKSAEQKEADKKFVDGELAKMQGKWAIASREGADEGDIDVEGAGLVVVIKDDILQHVAGDQVLSRQKMTILPNTEPIQIDLVYVKEDGTPETVKTTKKVTRGKKKDKTQQKTTVLKYKGIYSIEGDKLKIAWSWDDSKRSTDFTSGPGGYLLTLTKVKGKEEKKADKDKKDKETEPKDKKDKETKDKDKKDKETKDKDK